MGKVIEFYCDHCGKKLDQTVYILTINCRRISHGQKTGLDEYTLLGYDTGYGRRRLFKWGDKGIKRQLCEGCAKKIIEKKVR